MFADQLLTFLKEWVPSIAVLVGGGWILFQWLFGESVRRKKEIPALDGKLSARVYDYDATRLVVSLDATWSNRSPFPLRLDFKNCWIDVFRISPDLPNRNCPIVTNRDLGPAVCSHYFLVGQVEVDYVLEPNTESILVNHFVLEPGLYAFRMELRSFAHGGRWWKEMILKVSPAAAIAPDPVQTVE
ncbi:MAG: hypothetical protein ABI273_00595 [Lacunisphaera sp.]